MGPECVVESAMPFEKTLYSRKKPDEVLCAIESIDESREYLLERTCVNRRECRREIPQRNEYRLEHADNRSDAPDRK